MRRKDRDTYVLSTGRVIAATHGIIGIARVYGELVEETFESFEVAEGFGRHLDEVGERTSSDGRTPLTPAERLELADFMIAQWQDLKRHAAAAIGPSRRVTSSALDMDHGIVRMRLDCGHEAELQLADPVLAVTEAFALPKVGDELPCEFCRNLASAGDQRADRPPR
jgi:hypothetical protein